MGDGELPVGWARVPLAELLNGIETGKSFKCDERPPEADEVGVVKVSAVSWGEYREQESKTCLDAARINPHLYVQHGDFLFSRSNTIDLVGACVIAKRVGLRVMLSDKILRFQFADETMKPWVLNLLRSHPGRAQIKNLATGNQDSMRNIGQERIGQIEVPLPPPAERARILSRIDELFSELDKGVEALKTAQAQLKVYRQALLKHAFEGRLTADWRALNPDKLLPADQLVARIQQARESRHAEQVRQWQAAQATWEAGGNVGDKPVKPGALKSLTSLTAEEMATLPSLPEGWAWGKLGYITCGVEYGSAAKSSETGAVPVLRMGNIQGGKFDLANLVYTDDEQEIAKYALSNGDVLFNRTNSPELVGKSARFTADRPAIFAGYLIRVNHIESLADGQFLNLYLNSHVAKQHGNKVKTDGVNQSNINGDKLVNYPFPICHRDEQDVLVRVLDERLSICDAFQQTITTSLQQSEALRQAILKKAFSGQLVAQDPTDEPASALLARIRAARSAQAAKPRRAVKAS
jgi:type I restriction enzyme S subunit